MATLQEAQQKLAKKPFKKKEFRSYLSLDEVEEASDKPANPPIDKSNRTAVRSSSDHVEPTDLTASSRPPLPVQIEPVQTQPVQIEPEQSEPVHSEPVQLEPVHPEPVQAAPVHSEPVQDEPVQSAPVQDEPVQLEPVQNEPVQTEPVQTEPVLNEPVHSEPVQDVRVQSAPVQNERVCGGYFRLNLQEAYRLISELGDAELKIFLFLSLRAHGWDGLHRRVGDGTARAARSYIAQAIGSSETTVHRALPVLIQKGLIRKSRTSCKTGNIFEVTPCLLSPVQNEPVQTERVQKEPPSRFNLNGEKPFTRSKRTTNIEEEGKKLIEPPSDGSTLWEFFKQKLEGKGITAVRSAKGNTQCANLAKEYGLDRVKRAVTLFVQDDDPFVVEANYSLGVFVSRLQRYLGKKSDKAVHGAAWKDAPGGEA